MGNFNFDGRGKLLQDLLGFQGDLPRRGYALKQIHHQRVVLDLPTANRVAFDPQQPLAGGNPHPRLLQFALADLVVKCRAGVHHPAAEGHQRGVLHKNGCNDLRGPLDARCPVQLQPLGRSNDRNHPRLLVGAGTLKRHRRRELDVGIRFINDHADAARKRRGDAKRKLPARYVAADLCDELELESHGSASRQQHAYHAVFPHEPGLVFCAE